MASHTNKIIKQVNLNNEIYDIHDASAIHDLSDIEALGLEGAFVFKGVVATVNDLPSDTASLKVGYVYHVTENGSEYVWTTENKWEEFGHHMTLDHTHNVTVAGTNESSSVAGTATVTGVNKASNVTASGSISVPKVTKSANYVKLTKSNDLFLQSYPGSTKKLALGSVRGVSGEVDVIDSVNAPTTTVTGVSGSTTASKATALTAIDVAKVGTATTVVTGLLGGSVSAGSKAAWSASVDNDGVLSFSFTANTPTAVTLPTPSTNSITPAASAGSITPYKFDNVTVPVAASAATTVVTGVTTDTATVATANASATTVATGSLGDTGTGASVLVGLGTPTSARALINVELDEGTSSDILVGDTVAITTEDKTVDVTGTAAAQVWSQGSGAVVGTAAGQKWTQTSGTTGNPVSE